MCSKTCIEFGKRVLSKKEVQDKRILEVGSKNVNGSLRDICMEFNPKEYIGIDIEEGEGVNRLCNVYELTEEFDADYFDIVICTEVLEHLSMWELAIKNMEDVLKVGGKILLTTRSFGFGKHDHPRDYWRFEVEDILKILKPYDILKIEKDTASPGVFCFAKIPLDMRGVYDYRDTLKIYSMLSEKRITMYDHLIEVI